MIVILAGNHAQAVQYIREQRLPPKDCIIPTRPDQVAGLRITEVRKVGTWVDLPQPLIDAVEFRQYLGRGK